MDRPIIKEKAVLAYVEELEKRLATFEKSHSVESFRALSFQIDSWNAQLKLKPIDLFADKEEKSFDRTKWYFEKILDLNKSLAEIKKLMTPEEVEKIKPVAGSSAEAHIFNNRKS